MHASSTPARTWPGASPGPRRPPRRAPGWRRWQCRSRSSRRPSCRLPERDPCRRYELRLSKRSMHMHKGIGPASARARRVASAENSSTHWSIIRKLPLDLDICGAVLDRNVSVRESTVDTLSPPNNQGTNQPLIAATLQHLLGVDEDVAVAEHGARPQLRPVPPHLSFICVHPSVHAFNGG